jgi:uncharacterized protein YggE
MRKLSFVFLALTLALGFSAYSQIKATGSAQSLVIPTQFKATFAITSVEKSAYKAWKSAEEQAEDLVEDLNLQKHVRTIDLGETKTSQTYDRAEMEYMYQAVKLVVIEVDSIEAFEELTKDFLKEEVIQFQKLELMALNMDQLTQNLVALAIEEARIKAAHLAKSAGVKLGRAISIEVVEEPATTFIRANKLVEYQGLQQNKVHLTAQVKVSYAIKD